MDLLMMKSKKQIASLGEIFNSSFKPVTLTIRNDKQENEIIFDNLC